MSFQGRTIPGGDSPNDSWENHGENMGSRKIPQNGIRHWQYQDFGPTGFEKNIPIFIVI